MDIFQTIRELREERERLDTMIAILEARIEWERNKKGAPAKSRRGRKNMNPAERLQVSERMRRYWAARRESDLTSL